MFQGWVDKYLLEIIRLDNIYFFYFFERKKNYKCKRIVNLKNFFIEGHQRARHLPIVSLH